MNWSVGHPRKKGAFEQAAQSAKKSEVQSPLKLSTVCCIQSKLKRFQNVVKFDRPSNELETAIDFEYTDAPPPMEPVPDQPTIEIGDITLICDVVSEKGHNNIDNRPVIKVQLPYTDEPVENREAWINNKTGDMRLDLYP